jgi:hypothetical protein
LEVFAGIAVGFLINKKMTLINKYLELTRDIKQKKYFKESANNTSKTSEVDSTLKNLPLKKSTAIPTKLAGDNKTYKLYSAILDDHVWIVPDEEAATVARDHGAQDVIFTRGEIEQLKNNADHETLRQLHEIRKIFEKSRILKVKKVKFFDTSQCELSPAPWGECNRFDMKLGADNVLWPFCLKGKCFCPYSTNAKGVVRAMNVTEQKKAVQRRRL